MESELSFEEAMDKLESIVNKLETGNLNLEEALNAYSQGVALSKHCNKILDEAEGKVTMILKEDESFKEVDFITESKV